MLKEIKETDLFCEYYAKWITVYKKGAIRKVTMDKYLMRINQFLLMVQYTIQR